MITDLNNGDKVHIRWQGNSGRIYDWNCVLVGLGYSQAAKCEVLSVYHILENGTSYSTNIPIKMILMIESSEDWDLGI